MLCMIIPYWLNKDGKKSDRGHIILKTIKNLNLNMIREIKIVKKLGNFFFLGEIYVLIRISWQDSCSVRKNKKCNTVPKRIFKNLFSCLVIFNFSVFLYSNVLLKFSALVLHKSVLSQCSLHMPFPQKKRKKDNIVELANFLFFYKFYLFYLFFLIVK